jgi:hypothetical protein
MALSANALQFVPTGTKCLQKVQTAISATPNRRM